MGNAKGKLNRKGGMTREESLDCLRSKKDGGSLEGIDLYKLVNDIAANESQAIVRSEFDVVWNKYDTDGNGYLDTEEGIKFIKDFMTVLARCQNVGYEKLVEDLSEDPDNPSIRRTEGEVIRIFLNLVDTDNDGCISRSEFEAYLKTYLPS